MAHGRRPNLLFKYQQNISWTKTKDSYVYKNQIDFRDNRLKGIKFSKYCKKQPPTFNNLKNNSILTKIPLLTFSVCFPFNSNFLYIFLPYLINSSISFVILQKKKYIIKSVSVVKEQKTNITQHRLKSSVGVFLSEFDHFFILLKMGSFFYNIKKILSILIAYP